MFWAVAGDGPLDLEIRGGGEDGHPDLYISGGGERSPKKFFSALRASF